MFSAYTVLGSGDRRATKTDKAWYVNSKGDLNAILLDWCLYLQYRDRVPQTSEYLYLCGWMPSFLGLFMTHFLCSPFILHILTIPLLLSLFLKPVITVLNTLIVSCLYKKSTQITMIGIELFFPDYSWWCYFYKLVNLNLFRHSFS